MTGRAGIAAGTVAALAIAGVAGLVLFAVLFPVVMAVIGAAHRGRYR